MFDTFCSDSSLALPQVVFPLNTSLLILWFFGHTEREFRAELYIFAGGRSPAAEGGVQSFCLHFLIGCTVTVCIKTSDVISSVNFNVSNTS